MNKNIEKISFGKELKNLLLTTYNVNKVSRLALQNYLNLKDKGDQNFSNLIQVLIAMESGPEFELSLEELEKIADDLIAGKDVKL